MIKELEGLTDAQKVALLQEKLEKALKSGQRRLTCKVGQKGGISVYGLGKFPVTLFWSQWEQLIAFIKAGHLEEFAQENADLLATKD